MKPINNLRVFFLTVGETSTFESLDALKKHTDCSYKLTIWYDACDRPVDMPFFHKLQEYTDDVILSVSNHYLCTTLGYAMLYLDGDYIMLVPADNIVLPGYMDRFRHVISTTENVACIGTARVDDHPDFKFDFDMIMNGKYFRPDGVMLYPKDAILDIGSISPSFAEYGFPLLEWSDRAAHRGWNQVSCSGIAIEVNGMHEGREKNPNLQDEIQQATKTYLKIKDSGYKDFIWWDHRYREKLEPIHG